MMKRSIFRNSRSAAVKAARVVCLALVALFVVGTTGALLGACFTDVENGLVLVDAGLPGADDGAQGGGGGSDATLLVDLCADVDCDDGYSCFQNDEEAVCLEDLTDGPGCILDGLGIAVGDTFLRTDDPSGCEACVCQEDSTGVPFLSCDVASCEGEITGPDPTGEPFCVYDDVRVELDVAFKSLDGCNSCRCRLGPDGQPGVSCTERGCGPEVATCVAASDCETGFACSTDKGDCEAHPACSEGAACPAVCYGTCYETDKTLCQVSYPDGTSKAYAPGQRFELPGKENTCYCFSGGVYDCREDVPKPGAGDPQDPVGICVLGNNTYAEGAVVDTEGGCRACECGAGGGWTCKETACVSNDPPGDTSCRGPEDCWVGSVCTTFFGECNRPSSCPPGESCDEVCTGTCKAYDIELAACANLNCPSQEICVGIDGFPGCLEPSELSAQPVFCPTPQGTLARPRQIFPAPDGCNSCRCGDDGQVTCSKRPCSNRGKCRTSEDCSGQGACSTEAGSCEPGPGCGMNETIEGGGVGRPADGDPACTDDCWGVCRPPQR